MAFKKFFKKSGKEGFTLAELSVSVVILFLLMFVLVNLQRDIFSFNAYNNEMLSGAYNAQSILKTMVKELRPMEPGSDGSYPLVQAGTSSITFFSDINNDGLAEEINYFLSGNNLMKGVIVLPAIRFPTVLQTKNFPLWPATW